MKDLKKKEDSISNEEGISKRLINELVKPSFDLSIDYSEIFIDDLINNEAIKEIPVVKSVIGVVRTGIAINQFWFAKKLLVFIQTFNDGTISTDHLEKFKTKLENKENYGKRVAELLMIHIDRSIEMTKTKVISNLFKAYVNEEIEYDQLTSILITLSNLNPKAFESFFELEKIGFEINSSNHDEIGPRNFENETMITISGFATEPSDWFSGIKLTKDGELLFKHGIKPISVDETETRDNKC